MKFIYIVLITLLFTACGGGGSSTSDANDLIFTNEEVTNSVLVSKSILNFNPINANSGEYVGAIDLFGEVDFREISLSTVSLPENSLSTEGSAEYSDQPWYVLSNGVLQFDYTDLGICNATKVFEGENEIDVVGECQDIEGLELSDTLIKPLDFNVSDLYGKTVINYHEGGDVQSLSFEEDSTVIVKDVYVDSQSIALASQSRYKNVVKLDFDNNSSRLFILVEGSLNEGQMIEIQYNEDETRVSVHVRKVFDDTWDYPYGDYYFQF